tara:strand:- start:690 stop:1205 length:516 start_codon:yes stop_codon:yes gene_type:complete
MWLSVAPGLKIASAFSAPAASAPRQQDLKNQALDRWYASTRSDHRSPRTKGVSAAVIKGQVEELEHDRLSQEFTISTTAVVTFLRKKAGEEPSRVRIVSDDRRGLFALVAPPNAELESHSHNTIPIDKRRLKKLEIDAAEAATLKVGCHTLTPERSAPSSSALRLPPHLPP